MKDQGGDSRDMLSLKHFVVFYFFRYSYTSNLEIFNTNLSINCRKVLVFFVYFCIFYLQPKFGQLLRFRPNHSLTAKGFKKRGLTGESSRFEGLAE